MGNEWAKACRVALGCEDQNKYDVLETYVSVCRIKYIRLVISLAVTDQLKIISIDVTIAFLYGKINIDIFISIPAGLNIDNLKYALKL